MQRLLFCKENKTIVRYVHKSLHLFLSFQLQTCDSPILHGISAPVCPHPQYVLS